MTARTYQIALCAYFYHKTAGAEYVEMILFININPIIEILFLGKMEIHLALRLVNSKTLYLRQDYIQTHGAILNLGKH